MHIKYKGFFVKKIKLEVILRVIAAKEALKRVVNMYINKTN